MAGSVAVAVVITRCGGATGYIGASMCKGCCLRGGVSALPVARVDVMRSKVMRQRKLD